MQSNRLNRRRFLTTLAAASVAAGSRASTAPQSSTTELSSAGSPYALAGRPPALAIYGGKPVRKTSLTTGCGIGTEYYDEQERARLEEVLTSHNPFRWYGPGGKEPTQCATFEREFVQRMQCRYALGVTSGTAALQCAMAALGVGPGDEVILPAWTWYACYNAIVLAGALPVF
jgi:hypothetical protein